MATNTEMNKQKCYHYNYDNYILNGKCCVCDKPPNVSYVEFRKQLQKEKKNEI